MHKLVGITAREVALDEIEESPGPFCMSFGFQLDALIQSVQEAGLINPPILKSQPEGLTIVAGYRRILALRALKQDKAPCRVILEEDKISPLQCLLMNLYDDLATRDLNDVEKGMVLGRLNTWVPRQELVDRYMPLLGLRSQGKNLDFFLEMERDFGSEIKAFIAEGRLSWQAIQLVSDMDAVTRAAILNRISEFKLNINQQSQFVEYLIDLSSIEEKTILQIIEEDPLDALRSNTQGNRPQQAKALLSALRRRRNPSIVAAEKEFGRAVSTLNLPAGIKISAPPFFEGPYYTLEVLFKDGGDLRTRIEALRHVQGLSELGHPWKGSPK